MLAVAFIAAVLVAITVAIHAVGLSLVLSRLIKSHVVPPTEPWPITLLLVRVTWLLILIHAAEISVWANLLDDGHLRVVVSDNGEGMRERHDSPGLGLGLPLIDRLAEAVEVSGDGDGTHVRMDFALAV